jgi:pyroglutamyl-peptidase
MPVTILVTGFGPFPGAPFNPTAPLVDRLARLRRPRIANVKIIPHVFPTSYAAVDQDLPKLLARHRPDALLMFGLATRATAVRIETQARNAITLLPDAAGFAPRRSAITSGRSTLAIPAPVTVLLAAVRGARVPVIRSRDAGSYLCNYLCWRASEAAGKSRRPRLAAFIHVPPVLGRARPQKALSVTLSLDDLTRAASQLLIAMVAAARRRPAH